MPHVRPFSEPTAVPGQAGPRNDGELPLDRRIAGFGGDRKQRSSRLGALERDLRSVENGRRGVDPQVGGRCEFRRLQRHDTLVAAEIAGKIDLAASPVFT